MKKESIVMSRPTIRGRHATASADRIGSERGQMLVIFALALIALIGMVGLIIDGGDTFLQRRDQQNVADAAAMAAGYADVNGQSASAAAQTVAAANGYIDGQDGATVTVTLGSDTITVDVTRPHRNFFSGVMGFSSWNVSTTAAVQAGVPNAALGPLPIIFNEDAFHDPANRIPNSPVSFDEPGVGTEDVPQTASSFNWTLFCTASGNPCNGDSSDIDAYLTNNGAPAIIHTDDDIGPLNAGSHTTLFDDLAAKAGKPFAVAIVDDEGKMIGWAWFHLTGSVGGGTKQVSGWFEDEVNAPPMVIVGGHGQADGVFGAYSVKLID
jgi:Flp pilus assembly protein TadG